MIGRKFFGRNSSLTTEVLTAQLTVAVAVGVIALVGYAVITSSVIEQNLIRWASSWADQIEELGAPLYVGDSASAVVDIDRFIDSYPELVQVVLYGPDGTRVVAVENAGRADEPLPELSPDLLAALESLAADPSENMLTEKRGDRRYVLHGPIIVESLAGQNLLEFDPDTSASTTELLGFVSLELDFSSYFTALLPNLAVGAATIAVLILAGWAASRQLLKNALAPLEALQEPLKRLGRGQMDVELPRARHRELTRIVRVLRETIDRVRQREKHLVHLASRDALTGLYNRYRLMQELESEIDRCSHNERRSALLFIDLDQFKYVNDTGGHASGDRLLVTAASQISTAVRKDDVVARFGGDEFVVLLRDVKRRDASRIAGEVLESMRHVTHTENDRVFHLQCSIGVAIISSARHSPEEVVAHGDIACQAAKQRGRNRVEVYRISSKQGERMADDVRWMRRIRESLNDDSFVLHYQPLMHIETGEINHYEALLRVRTDRGLVSPATFLPAAARFGLMSAIDLWVLENAIRALSESGSEVADNLRLSVNLSGFALEETNLVARTRALLQKYGVPGDRLILELTEHLAVRFATDTDKRLDRLRALGCAIAIDDFGTGYSSFNYLKRLPADYLKIDGAFVRNLARDKVDQCMVRMTAELAHEVGLFTVAEYVRSAASMKLLKKYGIDYAQGSYIGKPAKDFRATPIAAKKTA